MAGGWENAERTPLQARISSPLSILYIVIGVSLNIRNHKTHKTYYFSKFEKIWQENYVWLQVSMKGYDDMMNRDGYLKKNTAPTASMKSQQNRYLLFNSPKSEKIA